jgi:aspartokinase/homoserine dehydrogenase 1
MSSRVIRFGGNSVGNTTSIQNLQTYLTLKEDQRTFIVVSSIPEMLQLIEDAIACIYDKEFSPEQLGNELNTFFLKNINSDPVEEYNELISKFINLLKGIALIGDYSTALHDQVISFSEKLTAEIFHQQWKKLGGESKVLWPEDIGLKTTSDFGNATFLSVDIENVRNLTGKIFIIPGSFGVDKNGKICRTGKTAADYCASALTAFLRAEKLELWGLDNNFQKADPDIVVNPPIIQRLTYSEAGELAYFDHYSFHPRTVELLEQDHIPIIVLNPESSTGKIDTTINTETFIDDKIVKSVACTDDISLIKMDGPGVGLKPGILAKVTSKLNDAGINIKSVITSQTSINIILEKSTGEKSLKLINKLGFSSVQQVSLNKDVSLIGIIGHGMQQNYGISARIFSAVAQNKINVILSGSGASELVSYLIVKDADKEKSVHVIYNAFFQTEN